MTVCSCCNVLCIVGVHVIVFSQFIGTTKMSKFYPDCVGHESSFSDCLQRHPESSSLCSARRVGALCFPTTVDIQTELMLCGFEIPINRSTTTQADAGNAKNSTEMKVPQTTTTFVAGNIKYTSGFNQEIANTWTAVAIVTFVAFFINIDL